MATVYPNEIDNSTSIPLSVNLITPVNSISFNNLRGAILSIENELGTNPSAEFSTVSERLSNINQQLSNRKITQVIQSNGVTGNITLIPSGHIGNYYIIGSYCKITTAAATGTVSVFVISDVDQIQIANNLPITSITSLLLPSVNIRSTGTSSLVVRFEFSSVTGTPVMSIGGTAI